MFKLIRKGLVWFGPTCEKASKPDSFGPPGLRGQREGGAELLLLGTAEGTEQTWT